MLRKRRNAKKRTLLEYNRKMNENRDFKSFRTSNFSMSETVYRSLLELQQNPPLADAYIVGSDQVWAHLLNTEENTSMFLNFGKQNTLRISYAPSFSMEQYPEELEERLKLNLSRFDSISVREQTGKRICSKAGFDSTVVLDPTLLLSSEQYREIKDKCRRDNYIYLYYLNIENAEEICWNELNVFAHHNRMSVIATPASGYLQGTELFDGVEYEYATIPQWIGLIDGASIVVTTSFHGVVFCILHHTPFIYFPLKGKYSRGNNRVVDLCNILGLLGRIWNDSVSYEQLAEQRINWKLIDEKLNSKRTDSILFLKNALI